MRQFTATEAKNRFGELLDASGSEPVAIQKNGRNYRVILSSEEFERIVAASAGIDPTLQTSLERSIRRWNKVYEELAK
jgi:prevent-host-death family protein